MFEFYHPPWELLPTGIPDLANTVFLPRHSRRISSRNESPASTFAPYGSGELPLERLPPRPIDPANHPSLLTGVSMASPASQARSIVGTFQGSESFSLQTPATTASMPSDSDATTHTERLLPIVPLTFAEHLSYDPESGEWFRVTWTGGKDDPFFALHSIPLMMTYQEGCSTQVTRARVHKDLKDWKTTTELLEDFISCNTANDDLKNWFTSPMQSQPSRFARLLEAAAVSSEGGANFRSTRTSRDDLNDQMLTLPSDAALPDFRSAVDRRKSDVLKERKNGRRRAHGRMMTLLKTYNIRNGVVEQVKAMPDHKLFDILQSALDEFHLAYHSWRQYEPNGRFA